MFAASVAAASTLLLGLPPSAPSPDQRREEQGRRIDDLTQQLGTLEQVEATKRHIRLQEIGLAIGRIESCQRALDFIAKKDGPQFDSLREEWRTEVRDAKKTLERLQPEIDKDPSLVRHAKLMNAEYDRLIAEERAKGEEHFQSEKVQKELAVKFREVRKKYDKPDPPEVNPAEPAKK